MFLFARMYTGLILFLVPWLATLVFLVLACKAVQVIRV